MLVQSILVAPLDTLLSFAMSTLQHFHRFCDLPRELQLHIWELYELAQPHHRHYFRNMMVWSGRLYAGADYHTNRRVSNVATADEPDQTRVPDAAITPSTKIQLPDGGSQNHWISDDEFPAAATFSAIQTPTRMTRPAYIWVNFKYDAFCFARNPERDNNGESKNFFQYLQGATGMFTLNSPQQPLMSHWFFRIQRLVLISSDANKALGPFDRQVLRVHPCLRELTIVATLGDFRCRHLTLGTLRRPDAPSDIERLPLREFLALRQAVTRSCICKKPQMHLDQLQRLGRDIADLFRTRTNTAPLVSVETEVEVYWAQRPNIESLLAGTEAS